jgi:hypothetical protein
VPIYELACEDGHRSETLQASTDPLPPAPKGHTHGPGAKDRPGPGAKEREDSGT